MRYDLTKLNTLTPSELRSAATDLEKQLEAVKTRLAREEAAESARACWESYIDVGNTPVSRLCNMLFKPFFEISDGELDAIDLTAFDELVICDFRGERAQFDIDLVGSEARRAKFKITVDFAGFDNKE